MDLRYRLAVVTGAGDGLGREIAVAVSRVGAAVLAVDHDLGAAEQTASLVREARVSAWALQVDLADETDLQLVADRARDLGGIDLLVNSAGDSRASSRLTQLFLAGLTVRRGRRDGTPAVVTIGPPLEATVLADGTAPVPARLMTVVPGTFGLDHPSEVTRVVVNLLCRGTAGEVVELSGE